MPAIPKPGLSPELLRLLMFLGGVLGLVALPWVPADHRIEVGMAAAGLLGWAKHAPGAITATTHPDDI